MAKPEDFNGTFCLMIFLKEYFVSSNSLFLALCGLNKRLVEDLHVEDVWLDVSSFGEKTTMD